jgi:putative ABC transport system substrate-binding protein
VKSAEDFDAILAVVMAERADALFVYPDSVTYKYREALVRFVAEMYPIPTMFQQDFYVDAGGLLSYYTSFGELRRQAAGYVDKVFKGAKPADLPVQQPSRFDFIVNLKTAKLLGLTDPAISPRVRGQDC